MESQRLHAVGNSLDRVLNIVGGEVAMCHKANTVVGESEAKNASFLKDEMCSSKETFAFHLQFCLEHSSVDIASVHEHDIRLRHLTFERKIALVQC